MALKAIPPLACVSASMPYFVVSKFLLMLCPALSP